MIILKSDIAVARTTRHTEYLRYLEEPQQVGDLHRGDAAGGAHHSADNFAHSSRVALVLLVVNIADRPLRTSNNTIKNYVLRG